MGDNLESEFDRQVERLVRIGYPEAAGMTIERFEALLEPLRAQAGILAEAETESSDTGRIPFVVVVTQDLVSADRAMPLVDLKGKKGFSEMDPGDIGQFGPLAGIKIPASAVYLMTDVDTGGGTLNVTPDDALALIAGEHRSPLTLDEGVALLLQFPTILKDRNAFSLLGSRCGDRRVTALWMSKGRPRLGWCWAGNPHTWLGSASCGGRLGP